jgi:hypothetical protein
MIKAWLANNLWWILIVIGCTGIVGTNVVAKLYGLTIWTYLLYVFVAASWCGWAFTYSYQISPTFLQPFFVAQGTLGLLGFAVSMLYLDVGVLSLWQIIGAALTIVGGVLLVL